VLFRRGEEGKGSLDTPVKYSGLLDNHDLPQNPPLAHQGCKLLLLIAEQCPSNFHSGLSGENMIQAIGTLITRGTVMFEYDVHDMQRAVDWYRDVLGLETRFRGGDCHTEFALPVPGARLAPSLAENQKTIHKAARLFLRTNDIHAVETYLTAKRVTLEPIKNVDNVVLILWVEDSEENHFAFEQWVRRN
jgi:catechol 2,3-dioxygenase-like lactoylglutathione lyase family enzyme